MTNSRRFGGHGSSSLLWTAVLAVVIFGARNSYAQAGPSTFTSDGRKISYETFSSPDSQPTLILLPGSSGPEAGLYREQAKFYSDHGFRVLLLHYYDAADSHSPGERTYIAWARALTDFVREIGKEKPGAPIDVVGYSLGASVALAAGSQGLPVSAIAEWYGSLPDYAFYSFKSMPPLLILHGARDANIPVSNAQQLIQLCSMKSLTCDSRIYPDEAHGFSGAALADAQRHTLEFFAKHAAS